MNKFNNIISNQTEFGCSYCGKNYKTRIYLNKHKVLCETLTRAKNKNKISTPEFTDIEPLPSQTQMYKIILDLSLKCNRLEEKVNDMQIWMDKKKKKINIIDWLRNYKHIPKQTFLQFQESIQILPEEVELILNQSYLQVFQNIINRIFQSSKEDGYLIYPIFHHLDKPTTIFIYNDIYYENNQNQFNNVKWVEANKEQILGFFKNIHFIFGRAFIQWKQNNQEKINMSENLTDSCNKANIKIMGIQFKEDPVYHKWKASLINAIKIPSLTLTNKE
jgi:hypothetical protein